MLNKIRTIIVDDMPKARRMLIRMLEREEEVEIVAEMGTAVEAITYIETNAVDLVFMDIEMPGMTGTEGSKVISQMENSPLIVFVTAYVDYMADAWKTDAIYYIVKPFDVDEIHEAIRKYKAIVQRLRRVEEHTSQVSEVMETAPIEHVGLEATEFHGGLTINGYNETRIVVMCFPTFDVKVDGITVHFKSKRSKELMAYLIHSKGAWIENSELCANILEDMDEDKAKNNLRTYIRRLKLTLDYMGAPDVIEQSYGKIRINTEAIACDYYLYLSGNPELFKGEYLREYSWAEPAVATMYNKSVKKNRG